MPTLYQLVSISHFLFFSQAEKKAIQSEVPLGLVSGGSRKFGGGMIKILSTKPQKFGCVVTRRVARNSQWSGCSRGLGAKPPALKNFAFFCKNNLILELVW